MNLSPQNNFIVLEELQQKQAGIIVFTPESTPVKQYEVVASNTETFPLNTKVYALGRDLIPFKHDSKSLYFIDVTKILSHILN